MQNIQAPAHIVARIAAVLRAGRVLCEPDKHGRCRFSVGPYQAAVDQGHRFALLVEAGKCLPKYLPDDAHCASAEQAALLFCDAVGVSPAHLAALEAAKKHGLVFD